MSYPFALDVPFATSCGSCPPTFARGGNRAARPSVPLLVYTFPWERSPPFRGTLSSSPATPATVPPGLPVHTTPLSAFPYPTPPNPVMDHTSHPPLRPPPSDVMVAPPPSPPLQGSRGDAAPCACPVLSSGLVPQRYPHDVPFVSPDTACSPISQTLPTASPVSYTYSCFTFAFFDRCTCAKHIPHHLYYSRCYRILLHLFHTYLHFSQLSAHSTSSVSSQHRNSVYIPCNLSDIPV